MTTAALTVGRRPWIILALICVPVFLGSLDLTIVSAFLPEIIVKLELPVQSVIDDAAWIVTAYLLAYTVSMTFMGRVSDLIGRRAVFIACLIVFAIGSLIVAEVAYDARSGLAGVLYNLSFRLSGERPEPGNIALLTIIIGRVIQALGAGALVPVALALVGDLFPPQKRAQPLGLVGAIDTLGWVLGHLYGGIMVAAFAAAAPAFADLFARLGLNWDVPDWRWLFWINIPITIAAIGLTWWALRDVKSERAHGRFDWLGALLLTVALVMLVLGLGANIDISAAASDFSDLGGLPTYALPAVLGSALLFAAFLFTEWKVRDPLFDLRIFRRRNLSGGALVNLLVGFALMIALVSVPILVNIRAADASALAEAALQVGILLSAFTLPMALAAIPGGWVSTRLGYGRAAAIGLGLALVGFLLVWATWELDTDNLIIALEMAVIGVGIGLTFSPISAAVINAVENDRLGSASALVIIMRLLGMTIGVALLTAIASSRLSALASAELGQTVVDPYAAIDVYSRLTVQVLTEIAFLGAVVCGIALVPALLLKRLDADPQSPAHSPSGRKDDVTAALEQPPSP
ncbi:MAG TPA: MFS transporter [Candidatus Limnocylindrales bacterium]|nr:MFS transporter [Candidatus Limnocylindrales bacterium]